MIRPARIADLAAIEACARSAYQLYVARMGREPAPMIADFAGQIAQGIVDVLEVEGGVCGFVIYYPRGDHMQLENVAVAPAGQGRGLGRQLIAHVEATARTLGIGAVELYTNEKMTENIPLYLDLGYVELGRWSEDGFNRVFFRKTL